MMWKPTSKNVLIDIVENPTTSPSGLALVITPEPSNRAVIVAKADDVTSCDVLDEIIFNRFAVVPVKINNKSYLIVEEKNILAVMIRE